MTWNKFLHRNLHYKIATFFIQTIDSFSYGHNWHRSLLVIILIASRIYSSILFFFGKGHHMGGRSTLRSQSVKSLCHITRTLSSSSNEGWLQISPTNSPNTNGLLNGHERQSLINSSIINPTWQGNMESNHNHHRQRVMCYHYTIPHLF